MLHTIQVYLSESEDRNLRGRLKSHKLTAAVDVFLGELLLASVRAVVQGGAGFLSPENHVSSIVRRQLENQVSHDCSVCHVKCDCPATPAAGVLECNGCTSCVCESYRERG